MSKRRFVVTVQIRNTESQLVERGREADCYSVSACPACESIQLGAPVERYTAEQAAGHFCPPWRNANRYERLQQSITKLWGGNTCVIRQCGACGFAFGDPFVGGDEEFYSILHEQHGYPSWRWDYDIAIREVLALVRHGRLLEIGAGEGVFLKYVGRQWKTFAVEATETTRALLQQNGISVFPSLQEVAQRHVECFDVVTMFQVLEHIAPFHEVLKLCHELLRSGGRLIVTVPACEAMLLQPRVTGEPDMPPNHINKFTPRSLDIAMTAAGFRVLQTVYEPWSLRKISSSIYSRVHADSVNPRTFAAKIYRLQNRKLRIPILAIAGVLSIPRLLPFWRHLGNGGAFGMIAERT
jgi:SAM-dependent methyltransferase